MSGAVQCFNDTLALDMPEFFEPDKNVVFHTFYSYSLISLSSLFEAQGTTLTLSSEIYVLNGRQLNEMATNEPIFCV